jgi:hemolysin activation/secretion protein
MLTRYFLKIYLFRSWLYLSVALLTSYINIGVVNAQTIDLAQVPNIPNTNNPNSSTSPNRLPAAQDVTPSTPSPSSPQIPKQSSPQENVLPSPSEIPEVNLENCSAKITVTKFVFDIKHPVFPNSRLDTAVNNNEFLNKPLSCTELFRAALEITKIYHDNKYQTSGAKVIIPTNRQENYVGEVTIKVIEGKLEDIKVIPFCPKNQQNSNSENDCTKTKPLRLDPEYVRSRLNLAKSIPLNINRLQEALQLLRLNAPIENISAKLYDGSTPGSSILEVQIKEANTFNTALSINNSRSPSSGSFQRRAGFNEANFLGMGDSLSGNYNNTDGSNGWDISYTVPFNPRNGTLNFSYSDTSSNVIEPPFKQLDINSQSRALELTVSQPILQTIKKKNQEENSSEYTQFSLGLTFSRKESETSLLGTPYPLSPGANDQGQTRISALRFFQEWSKQNSTRVIAVRSQFNLGIGAFDTTINQPISGVNEVVPDNRFFSWQGQAQWVQFLAPETPLLLRTNMQLAGRTLVPLEQFAIGGAGSVRGYRQEWYFHLRRTTTANLTYS